MSLFSREKSAEVQREEAAQRDFQRSQHQNNLAQPVKDAEDEFDDLVESGVPEDTVYQLRHLMSKDWVLGRLSSAELDEAKWLSRALVLQVQAMHPHKDSWMSGEYRNWLLDGKAQSLETMSDYRRAEIKSFIMGFWVRLSRSHEGWQQEERSKQTRVSIAKDETGSEKNEGMFK